MKNNALIFLFFFALFSSRGAEFDLGTNGVLSVNLPARWTVTNHRVNRPDGTPIGYAFSFRPTNVAAKVTCLLTLVQVTNGLPDKATIQKEVRRICQQFVSESVEKKENLQDFYLKNGCGSYCLFTDASLVGKPAEAEEYKILGAGEVQPGRNILGVVSLFADDPESPELKAMIQMINSLELTPENRQ